MAKDITQARFANIKKIYNRTIDFVFAVILLFITLTMVIGVVRLFYRVSELFQQSGITGSYLYIFADVLTLYILIELSRSLMDYFETQQMRLTPIIDAGMVFVLRHIMIELFNHKLDPGNMYALSVLLFTLAAIRFSTAYKFKRENESEITQKE